MGKGYVIEHCISFFRKKQEERLFRNYVTDALRILTYNTSQKGNGIIEQRYCDIIAEMNTTKKKETRTEKEIINSISDKLRKMSGE